MKSIDVMVLLNKENEINTKKNLVGDMIMRLKQINTGKIRIKILLYFQEKKKLIMNLKKDMHLLFNMKVDYLRMQKRNFPDFQSEMIIIDFSIDLDVNWMTHLEKSAEIH